MENNLDVSTAEVEVGGSQRRWGTWQHELHEIPGHFKSVLVSWQSQFQSRCWIFLQDRDPNRYKLNRVKLLPWTPQSSDLNLWPELKRRVHRESG